MSIKTKLWFRFLPAIKFYTKYFEEAFFFNVFDSTLAKLIKMALPRFS